MDSKESLLSSGSGTQLYGKSSDVTMGIDLDTDINGVSGLSKRNGGGLWDDDEE